MCELKQNEEHLVVMDIRMAALVVLLVASMCVTISASTTTPVSVDQHNATQGTSTDTSSTARGQTKHSIQRRGLSIATAGIVGAVVSNRVLQAIKDQREYVPSQQDYNEWRQQETANVGIPKSPK